MQALGQIRHVGRLAGRCTSQAVRAGSGARARSALIAVASTPPPAAAASAADALQGPARIFHACLKTILDRYWATSPTAQRVVDVLYAAPGGFGADQIAHDHLAFRTFGVPGLGIDSLGGALEAFGYTRQDASVFPNKKLTATWYAPPAVAPGGPPAYELLPRIFVSQIEVGKLSPGAQSVILRYTSGLSEFTPVAAWSAALSGALPWGPPEAADYEALLGESEYAAWVLANGYGLNHTALSVHRIRPAFEGGLEAFNARLQAAGFALNGEGGLVKASPDGLLLQSSTVADLGEVHFAGGAGGQPAPHRVVRAYLEFVERRPLPAHAGLPPEALAEAQRRDGFEASSADNIFASTTLAARAM